MAEAPAVNRSRHDFSLSDRVIDRATGRTLEGGEPGEVTELWTFMRGGDWLLSAIQQT